MAFRMSRFVCNAATTAAAATVENIDELCIGFVYEGEKIPQFSSTFFNAHCHFFLLRNSETKAIKSAKKESERKKKLSSATSTNAISHNGIMVVVGCAVFFVLWNAKNNAA